MGSLVINGKEYTSDLIIYPDGNIVDSWWRKSSHGLSSNDIDRLIQCGPEIIIAGTGVNGLMEPEKELEKLLNQRKIGLIAEPNTKAMDAFNELSSKKRIGACFHLTC